jgi:hypothetical protein
MEIVYSIFIDIIVGKIASKIDGIGLQCRRDTPLRPKALLRQKEGGEQSEEGLHKTSPCQSERPRPRREQRWLWPVAPARGPWR